MYVMLTKVLKRAFFSEITVDLSLSPIVILLFLHAGCLNPSKLLLLTLCHH